VSRSRFVVQTLVKPDDEVDPRVDAVELRLDLYPDLDAAAFLAASGKPVVACVRRAADGGAWDGDEAGRRGLLASCAAAAYVDEEVDAEVAPPGARRIVSFHDVRGLPDDLDDVFERCLRRGADIVKIAATPASEADAFRLLDLPTSGLALGEYGSFTRPLAPLTYCAHAPPAPGMPTPAELFDLYAVGRLGPRPALYGVAGDPIAHSRSPALHNAGFVRDGLDALYMRFRVSDLAAFWPAFVAHGGRGLSVTAPLKEQAAALARAPDESVTACGSANTLLADGRAFNTDYLAFLDLLPPDGDDALVMGAGGAARAAVAALRKLGYRIRVWNRTPERARALGVEVVARPEPAAVVVNTTPVPAPSARFVLDLRYGPGYDAGVRFLEAQARHQYRLFTGHEL
jgi:3-dehydroquinate dehydratase type I